MFSENAKAFCIENLLGLDLRNCKQNAHTCDGVGEICPVPGQGTQCVHNSTQIVHDDAHSKNISIELCQSDLWHSFHALGTEMIITKSGRRMFPAVRCKVHGLDPKSKYRVYIDFVQLDRHKYRYVYHRSSLEAMIECYGLQFTENEINRRCPKNESKLIEQGYPSPVFSVSPLSNELPTEVSLKNRLTTDNVGRTFSPDFGIKPTFNTFFSDDVPRVTYDFCGKSASALKKENGHSIAETDSFIHHNVRFSPYSDTSYYSHSVKPRLKVFHYDIC
ncbi:TBX15 [Mytilus coruscus]|uniref:TBX15 n=1 Tax=Mytilus coruscus TaxID=42192 RepID=A0A6J8CA01_MYTCO|nr:TBX15 [Mytilus coruscus]